MAAPMVWGPRAQERRLEVRYGPVIHETRSAFSHIRVRDREGIRSLMFVGEHGTEQRQSAIDLDHPEQLVLAYTRAIFASYLFRQPQDRVLIVGLGGGGMVRFLNHHFPKTQVEAVEIDPAVVAVAAEFFGTMGGPRTTIHTEDAFVFLREPQGPYDVIYMDAFLVPPMDSDLGEKTHRLKTTAFLEGLQRHLKPEGLLACNLIERDASTQRDLEALRSAFAQVHTFTAPGSGNLVVVASRSEARLTETQLRERASMLEERFPGVLEWRALVRQHRS